ncbi:tyrosine-type recombinase/integrase [Dankookia rubra]|nr:tyrosine-type recombinase/integrase [Dankookia rubra]
MNTCGDGRVRPYYRRVNPKFRQRLPDDLDSTEFEAAYQAAAAAYIRLKAQAAGRAPPDGSVAAAIADYRNSVEFREHPRTTRDHYETFLRMFGNEFGHLTMRGLTSRGLDDYRLGMYEAKRAASFNEIRKVMINVTKHFIKRHPGLLKDGNLWRDIDRLPIAKVPEQERQNRPWPLDVIAAVFSAATPGFRALLTLYLYTGQRGGDVVRFTVDDDAVLFDPEQCVLRFAQNKTHRPMDLPVPEELRPLLTRTGGGSALLTPRGVPWTLGNARETLRTLLTNLNLPRYTLHGLRSTLTRELAALGFNEMVMMLQCGWTDSREARRYLRGVEQARVLVGVPTAVAGHFGPTLEQAALAGNERRFAGKTGRAAAKAGVVGNVKARRRDR